MYMLCLALVGLGTLGIGVVLVFEEALVAAVQVRRRRRAKAASRSELVRFDEPIPAIRHVEIRVTGEVRARGPLGRWFYENVVMGFPYGPRTLIPADLMMLVDVEGVEVIPVEGEWRHGDGPLLVPARLPSAHECTRWLAQKRNPAHSAAALDALRRMSDWVTGLLGAMERMPRTVSISWCRHRYGSITVCGEAEVGADLRYLIGAEVTLERTGRVAPSVPQDLLVNVLRPGTTESLINLVLDRAHSARVAGWLGGDLVDQAERQH
jgi:hypothetical protein